MRRWSGEGCIPTLKRGNEETLMVCRHCEGWSRERCLEGRPHFPGNAEWCDVFYRAPGSDDELQAAPHVAPEFTDFTRGGYRQRGR